MKTLVKNASKDQQGKVLIMVLVLLVVGGLVLAPLLGLMSTGLAAGAVYEKKTDQLYAADAGIEDAINWLIHGKPVDWDWTWNEGEQIWERGIPLDVNDNDVGVTVEQLPEDNTYKVTATATDGDRSTTVLSTLWAIARISGCSEIGEHDTFVGDVHVTGDLTAGQYGTIVGNLIVDGDVTMQQHSGIEGDMLIDGDLHVGQYSSIEGDVICLTGDVTLENNSEINADIHFLGEDCTLRIAKPDAYIRGNIWADGALTISIDQGNAVAAEVAGHVYAPNGNVYVYLNKPNAELQGDIYAGGSIAVSGNGAHTGTAYAEYDGAAPFTIPECPALPVNPVEIYTYEIS